MNRAACLFAIGDFDVLEKLGHGSFAVVWKAMHQVSRDIFAIKEIETEHFNGKLLDALEMEINVMRRIHDPHIIRCFDVLRYETQMYLILEYCDSGDVDQYIRRHGQISESISRNLMSQLASGLGTLRRHNLFHRDLKPQNLLLAKNQYSNLLHLKIADFGFVRYVEPYGMADTLCGSPMYMAPEILQGKQYDERADLWSSGAILWELLTGTPPFLGANHMQLLQNIQRGELHWRTDLQISEESKDFVRHLLQVNPSDRMSFEDFLTHPWHSSWNEHQYPAFMLNLGQILVSSTRAWKGLASWMQGAQILENLQESPPCIHVRTQNSSMGIPAHLPSKSYCFSCIASIRLFQLELLRRSIAGLRYLFENDPVPNIWQSSDIKYRTEKIRRLVDRARRSCLSSVAGLKSLSDSYSTLPDALQIICQWGIFMFESPSASHDTIHKFRCTAKELLSITRDEIYWRSHNMN